MYMEFALNQCPIDRRHGMLAKLSAHARITLNASDGHTTMKKLIILTLEAN